MRNKEENKANKKEREELILAILNAKIELEVANKNFEHAESKEMTDYYSYQIKAMKIKYDYLIKKVKEKGILLDIINEINIRYKVAI